MAGGRSVQAMYRGTGSKVKVSIKYRNEISMQVDIQVYQCSVFTD